MATIARAANEQELNNRPKSKIQNPAEKFRFWMLDREKKCFLDSGFWILQGSTGHTTRQFSDGGSEVRGSIPPWVPTHGRFGYLSLA